MENIELFQEKLLSSIRQLRTSIDDAMDTMLKMYGEEHHAIKRLRSYYPALDKQLEYAKQLEHLSASNDYQEYMSVAEKIRGISDMIKVDAKSLLNNLTTGKDIIPDNESVN